MTASKPQYTGIFPAESGRTPQRDECYCCGKIVKPGAWYFYLDRETREVMNPATMTPELEDRAMFLVPIGPECRKAMPKTLERYAVGSKRERITCETCGRVRKIIGDTGKCGTCLHREERRINCREMWGHGRRGY